MHDAYVGGEKHSTLISSQTTILVRKNADNYDIVNEMEFDAVPPVVVASFTLKEFYVMVLDAAILVTDPPMEIQLNFESKKDIQTVFALSVKHNLRRGVIIKDYLPTIIELKQNVNDRYFLISNAIEFNLQTVGSLSIEGRCFPKFDGRR